MQAPEENADQARTVEVMVPMKPDGSPAHRRPWWLFVGFAALALVAVLVYHWIGPEDTPTGPATQTPTQSTTTTSSAAAVDLQPVDMRFDRSGQPEPLRYTFVLEMRNNEAGAVDGFDVDCSYENAGIRGGIDAVTAGVLRGFGSFTYTQLTAVQGPTPSTALVECVVDPDNAVAETNEDNNVIRDSVTVP